VLSGASCYNCTNRKPGCHATCETYLKYKERLAKIKEKKEAYRRGFPLSKIKKCRAI